jgi:hypothetical protein
MVNQRITITDILRNRSTGDIPKIKELIKTLKDRNRNVVIVAPITIINLDTLPGIQAHVVMDPVWSNLVTPREVNMEYLRRSEKEHDLDFYINLLLKLDTIDQNFGKWHLGNNNLANVIFVDYSPENVIRMDDLVITYGMVIPTLDYLPYMVGRYLMQGNPLSGAELVYLYEQFRTMPQGLNAPTPFEHCTKRSRLSPDTKLSDCIDFLRS